MSQYITIGTYYNSEFDTFPVSDIVAVHKNEKAAISSLKDMVKKELIELAQNDYNVEEIDFGPNRTVLFYGFNITTFEIHKMP